MKPVECSTELLIDSIVLNADVMHSIRNNLPVPVNLVVQKVKRPPKKRVLWPIALMFFALVSGSLFLFSQFM